jgi:hypothetical protein
MWLTSPVVSPIGLISAVAAALWTQNVPYMKALTTDVAT